MKSKPNRTKVVAFVMALSLTGTMCIHSMATERPYLPMNEDQREVMKEAKAEPCWPADLPLPANARLLAAGAYAGRDLEIQIDSSGHKATQIDVIVNVTDAPVLLMLGAYEPTVWAISWTEGTRLLGVLVSGNYRQVVAALPAEIPVIESALANQYRCGSFYVAEDRLHQINPVSKQVFGRSVDMVYLAKEGRVVVGADLTPGTVLAHSTAVDANAFRLRGTLLAGMAGLVEAEQLGLLRKATSKDAQEWVKAYRRNEARSDDPPVFGQAEGKPLSPTLHNAYVVTKEFTFPAGLYGGDLATFYIPAGVPTPTGNPGHSTVFDLATGTCRGAMCKAL